MNLRNGSVIKESSTGKKLKVERILPEGMSKIIDFMASYEKPCGKDQHGNLIYPNRGFNFKDENSKWELLSY